MNVFVLSTGRCGSMTFSRACRYVTNYTTAHEGSADYTLKYPDRHIEVDNRLSWMLGMLHEKYPRAYYVHLLRDRRAAAHSYAARGAQQWCRILHGWIFAHKQGRPVKRAGPLKPGTIRQLLDQVDLEVEALQMVDTINANIRQFTGDKPHITIRIETAAELFPAFWQRIRARGNLEAALAELARRYNRGPAS